MRPKDADGVANSVDPDQTDPPGKASFTSGCKCLCCKYFLANEKKYDTCLNLWRNALNGECHVFSGNLCWNGYEHENLWELLTVIEIFEQIASAFESDLKETAGNKKNPDALHSSYQRKITASVY